MPPQFWTYILTDWKKNVLYTGITNNLADRLVEHWIGKTGSFTTRYNTYYLVWHESSRYVLNAIAREKEIKDWKREAKETLINGLNPDWQFLNAAILGNWPPTEIQIADVKKRRGRI